MAKYDIFKQSVRDNRNTITYVATRRSKRKVRQLMRELAGEEYTYIKHQDWTTLSRYDKTGKRVRDGTERYIIVKRQRGERYLLDKEGNL